MADQLAEHRRIFATLTPQNTLARIAFSEVAAQKLAQPLKTDPDEDAFPLLRPGIEKIYDADIFNFRWRLQNTADSHDDASSSFSDSATDPDDDVKEENRELGEIWTGHYVFTFAHPRDIAHGWVAGKSRQADLCLATSSFAKKHDVSLRTGHARFNFDSTTSMLFLGRSKAGAAGEISVNNALLPRTMESKHALNQHKMNIGFSNLLYTFEYTLEASSDGYIKWRREYIQGLPAVVGPQHEWPVPTEETRTLGQWTVFGPVGRGAFGVVSKASNHRLELVAVKVLMKDEKTAKRVDQEIEILQSLSDAVKAVGGVNKARIVRLREVFSQVRPGSPDSAPFDEVVLVLEPYMPRTLFSLSSIKK